MKSRPKTISKIRIALLVMAMVFLGSSAYAIPVVSTLGNPSMSGQWDLGMTIGQAFTTGQAISVGSATFEFFSGNASGYVNGYSPTSNAYLTIQDASGTGQIGSTTLGTWNTFNTSGNLITFSGNTNLAANTTYWLVMHDTTNMALALSNSSSYVTNYGATLPSQYNNFDSLGGPTGYWSLAQGPTKFEVNPVPIPGAVWLLGSGLVGLIGLKRRRPRK